MDIEKGWVLSTADFSMVAAWKYSETGTVNLVRVKDDLNAWLKLTADEREEYEIYATGRGKTFEEALVNANLEARSYKPIPS